MSEEKECIICLEPGTDSNPVLEKKADFENCECKNTYFHQDPCYTRYREQSNTCPTCRRGLSFQMPLNIGEFAGSRSVYIETFAAKVAGQIFEFAFFVFMIFTLAYVIKGMMTDPDMSSGNFNSTLGFTCLAYTACAIITHTRWVLEKFFSAIPSNRSRRWRQFTSYVYSLFWFKVAYIFYSLVGFVVVITSCVTFYSEDRAVVENNYLFVSLRIITLVNFISYGTIIGALILLCIFRVASNLVR